MASVIPENAKTIPPSAQADLPPPLPLDLEQAPDLPLQRRSPHSQVSSLVPSHRYHPRQRRERARVPMLDSQDDHYPAQAREESSVDMETHSRPLDLLGTRYRPYQVPRVQMGSGSRHPLRVDLTSGQALEVGLHRERMPSDQGQRPHWGQEQHQTVTSMQDMAWVLDGKTIALMESHPSRSTPLHSAHLAAESVDSQLSTRETGMREPVNLDRNQGDSASWNSVLQKTHPGVQNLRLAHQGSEEFYSLQLGIENHTPQQPQEVDPEQVAQDSLSVELQDSPSEIGRMAQLTQYQRAMSYSHGMRLQQEDQLRRIREKTQVPRQSTIQAQSPSLRNPHHPDHLQQYRRLSLSMSQDHQLPRLTDRPAHLTRPLHQIGKQMDTGNMRGIDLGLDSNIMALSAGEVHSQALVNTARSMVSQPGLPDRILPAALQQVQGHHYPQEVYHHRAPSLQQAAMPGDDPRISNEFRMASDNNSYGHSPMLPDEMPLATISTLIEGADPVGAFSSSDVDVDGREMGGIRGWGILPSRLWGDYSPGRVDTRNNQ
ncbi:hypothetical protein DFH05DRAFT_1463134 [Lentinula detonsa]|uniref:Uncharacterized protein n=1 Tax=Lentinula detonsa TaxID=2804962 RepID=A0A9W8TTX8_9AGAR|nr:hypothetical protein DFH05DRAFT_1463134 [Lentinula detonsa]KAJ3982979.1 hypothetical protein F5890DRAFT_266770 [Lentinula detonsa]